MMDSVKIRNDLAGKLNTLCKYGDINGEEEEFKMINKITVV